MASGQAIQNRIGRLLTKLQATDRVVSFRNVTTTGGNNVLGIGGSTATVDTVCDPQPTVTLLNAQLIANSGGLYQVGDYNMLFSGSVSEATLRNRLILYGDEVLRIIKIDPVVLSGIVIVWEVMARTVKAGS